tara:strand:- start:1382 stop:2680 length:1299 start_codon:yes stop_codon:yes gene_type:complete
VTLKKISIYLLLFFSLLLISKTHEDFIYYHTQGINGIFYDKLTLGLANLSIHETQVSLLSYIQALYFLPFFQSKLIHIPIFFIYFSTIGYFYQIISNKFSEKSEVFFALLMFFILATKFKRLSEFGYDYVAQFLILVSFHKIFYKNGMQEVSKSLLFLILAISSKLSALVSLPIFLLFAQINIIKKISFKVIFITFFMGMIITFNSFSRTGCLFYPINITCLDKNVISWSAKNKVNDQMKIVSSWAKGFYSQNKSKYEIILQEQNYLKNSNWIKVWVDIHFFYKIFEYLVILVFGYILLFFIFKDKIVWIHGNKKHLKYVFLSLASVLLWFFTVPQFRFGFASITISLFLIMNLIMTSDFVFKKNRIALFLIIAVIFFNSMNFIRIKNEFSRADLYQFLSFPWVNKDILKKRNIYSANDIEKNLFFNKYKSH